VLEDAPSKRADISRPEDVVSAHCCAASATCSFSLLAVICHGYSQIDVDAPRRKKVASAGSSSSGGFIRDWLRSSEDMKRMEALMFVVCRLPYAAVEKDEYRAFTGSHTSRRTFSETVRRIHEDYKKKLGNHRRNATVTLGVDGLTDWTAARTRLSTSSLLRARSPSSWSPA
jgi:hypothetical protein